MSEKPNYSTLEAYVGDAGGKAVTEATLRQYLAGKAGQDEDFRKTLLADPEGTVETEAGIKLPAGMKLIVHEEDADSLHLVLPAPIELDAGQLQGVAGGGWNYTSVDDPDIDVNDDDDMT